MKQVKPKKEKEEEKFNLNVYLMIIRQKYPDVVKYEDQVKLLNLEFGINVTERDLFLLEEPFLQDDELDYKLRYKVLGL